MNIDDVAQAAAQIRAKFPERSFKRSGMNELLGFL